MQRQSVSYCQSSCFVAARYLRSHLSNSRPTLASSRDLHDVSADCVRGAVWSERGVEEWDGRDERG